ncbi:divalent metal cation transporter [Candidatus Kaiserbacteria bacterium]|nr:divalent metal cation transporter [Candidatus Kaiserbacteria bacterium]
MNKGALEKEIEKAFEAPAQLLEEAVDRVRENEKKLISKAPFKRAEEYWNTLGPGLTTGAADDDPSGIATYSQAGARYGFQLIWTSFFTFPLMAVVQEMCARIGIVSGQGLAANIRSHYPARILYAVTALLFAVNAFTIAANLGAMAAATRLLLPAASSEMLVIFFALFSLFLQIFTTYARYAKYLKYLALGLLSYVAVALSLGLDWGDVFRHLVLPSITASKEQFFLLAAILGTTISPYLFFWQTSQEVEERIAQGGATVVYRSEINNKTMRRMRIDVWSGMFFSNLITFFIFAATAGTLYAYGIRDIVTVEQAALALRPFGEFAFWLFAAGIVGTGLLSVPVLAGSAAYALAESFKWKYGLYLKLKQARAFYGVIIVSMLLGIAANFIGLDPIRGLIYAAVGNALIAPFVLFFVVRIAGRKSIMGRYASHPLISFAGWFTILVMAASGAAAIWAVV